MPFVGDFIIGNNSGGDISIITVDIPSGMIMLWSGSSDNIPTGYVLCDGQNNTPDLRDRFIVGAGNSYNVNDTGGSNEVTLTVDEMPTHTHNFTSETVASQLDDSTSTTNPYVYQSIFANSKYYVNNTVSGSNENTGGGQAHENRPPYYALCYVMKV